MDGKELTDVRHGVYRMENTDGLRPRLSTIGGIIPVKLVAVRVLVHTA